MSWIEYVAAGLGIISVILAIQRSTWNYPFGLASVAAYSVVFFGAKLYSDVILQGYFFAMQSYGWWHWHQHRDADGRTRVEWLTPSGRLRAAAAVCALSLALGYSTSVYTDAALPWWDACIAGLSVVGQILQSRRKLECWPLWLVTNILAVGVYTTQHLYPTAVLFTIYLILSWVGWRHWQRTLKQMPLPS